ncbi:MAG: SNF2-related protein [Pseudomonadota bacterium]
MGVPAPAPHAMDRTAQLQRLLTAPWRGAFTRSALERGMDHAAQGDVLSTEVTPGPDRLSIDAEVAGTDGEPFAVELQVLFVGRTVKVSSTCTCTVGQRCRHAAAVLWRLEEDIERNAPAAGDRSALEPWTRWFERVAMLGADAGDAAAPEQVLVFLVDSAADAAPIPVLRVRPTWMKRLPDGGLGEPLPFATGALSARDWGPLLDDRQHDLMARVLLMPGAYHHGSHGYSLEGRRGERLLRDLLASQRCHFRRSTAPPLALGDPQPLEWRWRVLSDGSQRLEAVTVPGRQVARAEGLWYVDEAEGRIGLLQCSPVALLAVLDAPALRPEHTGAVAARWAGVAQLAGLPPPILLDAPEVLRPEPLPTLRLMNMLLKRPVDAPGRPYENLVYADFGFDYGGVVLPSESLSKRENRVLDGKPVTIERDVTREREAGARLRRAGLIAATASRDAMVVSSGRLRGSHYVVAGGRLDRAEVLLDSVPTLREAGFRVEFAPEFPLELLTAPDEWSARLGADGEGGWFDLELAVTVDGERIPLLPILLKALADRSLPRDDEGAGVWYAPIDDRRRLPLPKDRVRALVAPLIEWLDEAKPGRSRLRLPRSAITAVAELDAAGIALDSRTRERLRTALSRLKPAVDAPLPPVPAGFEAELRGYQLEGLRWLEFLATAGIGGVLADDMGLGKTVQVLAHVWARRLADPAGLPSLVVCPTSVLLNWREQSERFVPRMRLLALRGADRESLYARIADSDLVLTSYSLLARDRESLARHAFDLAVFDEAQAIKNAKAKTAQAARDIDARRKLAVTGTPLENHLGELWAQFDLVLPGLLGNERAFARYYRTPIEKHGDDAQQARLNRRIAPFILRRTKAEVAKELPPKTEIVQRVELEGRQRELYETLRLAMHERVRDAVAARGLAQSGIVVIDALLKLRQVCCDPRLVKLERAAEIEHSAKLDALLEMLEPLIADGRRILLFSQFTSMLDLIEQHLLERHWRYVRLDGATVDREAPINRFSRGDIPLFLLSLKAGGTGLNLTTADTVIHYDPWWNPAAETQATDRAHRIGQDKPVFVYKLICAGTVEERIHALQQRKSDLARAVLDGGTSGSLDFAQEDLDALFAPLG